MQYLSPRYLFLLLLLLAKVSVSAQTQKREFRLNCLGTHRDDYVRIAQTQPITPAFVIHSEKKRLSPEETRYWDSMRVNTRSPRATDGFLSKTHSSHDPVLSRSFRGNTNNTGTPLDNSVAVSKGGILVSAINTNYTFYDTLGNALLPKKDLELFRTDPLFISDPAFQDLSDYFYDPRVIYDPVADRFILVFLFGNDPTNSRIILLFSKTNNPVDGWHTYKINGNLGLPAWFDFPAIAVTKDELIITGNMFDISNPNTFQGTVIIQMDKRSAYNGQPLDFQTWYPVRSPNGLPVFTLYPCGDGQYGEVGPDVYLVGVDPDENQIVLAHITNNINAPNEQLEVFSIEWGAEIEAPANATQKTPSGATAADRRLDNGGARIRSAFILDGMIHLVFSNNNGQGYSEVAYARLDATTKVMKTARLGMPGKDYSYPSIASFSNEKTNKTVLITFLAADANTYPEIRAAGVDDNMNFSASILIRQGDNWVNYISNAADRWGDYTTSCVRYSGDSVQVWLSGCYGASNLRWQTQLACVTRLKDKQDSLATEYQISIFPNPSFDGKVILQPILENSAEVVLELYDMSGKFLNTIYKATLLKGNNGFINLDLGYLPAGVYPYHLKLNGTVIKKDKLIIGTAR